MPLTRNLNCVVFAASYPPISWPRARAGARETVCAPRPASKERTRRLAGKRASERAALALSEIYEIYEIYAYIYLYKCCWPSLGGSIPGRISKKTWLFFVYSFSAPSLFTEAARSRAAHSITERNHFKLIFSQLPDTDTRGERRGRGGEGEGRRPKEEILLVIVETTE